MTSRVADITAWVTLHPMLAYGVVFLLALSESIPLIGVIVPGTAVIVAVSALAPGGAIQLWPLVMAAFAGAVVGDACRTGSAIDIMNPYFVAGLWCAIR